MMSKPRFPVRMRVATVMPQDRIEVELSYTETLVPTEGTYEFVYPTVVGPRYPGDTGTEATNRWVASPYTHEEQGPSYEFALEGRVQSGVPVARLSVPSHRVREQWHKRTVVGVTLDGSERRGGDRDFVLRYELAGKQIEGGLLLYEGADENYFLLTVQPPARVEPASLPAREYVFVLDISGSMHGFPLDTAKIVLRDLARGLRPQDSFNVILFSGGSHLLWARSRPATSANVAHALNVIDNQQGGGGTELLSALQQAFDLPSSAGTSRSFVVVTDGYIAAEREVFVWIRRHLSEANVFSFGIGSSVNRYLIDGIAKAGKGEAFVITDHSESSGTADRFRSYIAAPVLTDIKLKTQGFAAYDMEPKAMPDLLAQRPLVVHGKWRGQPNGKILISGFTGHGAFAQSYDVAAADTDPANAPLERLWARQRIANVSDFSFGEETAAEKQLITELGLRYSLLTAYTSFVAVSRKVRNHGASQDVDQPLPLPLGVSDQAVGAPIYGAPEPDLAPVLLLVALLLALAWWRQSRSWVG